MKFLHLSDLHLGKRVNEYSMLDDQRYILRQILDVIQAEQPDAILIAGDIYDKPVPPAEAVDLFDDFLFSLAQQRRQVFIISGNHDSPDRLAFASRLIDVSGIHISPVYRGSVAPFVLEDDYGPVSIYLLPFLKPANVRAYFPEAEICSYTDALRAAVDALDVDTARRNVLITHQFVTGALRSDSEEVSVGGTDNVDAAVFADFDYVALGHIHGPQNVGSPRIRYCGTPLKYSFSEAGHQKSITIAELGKKGSLDVRTIPLKPLRDMVELRGTYEAVTRRDFYQASTWQEDYVHMTLTDEDAVPDAAAKLHTIYHHLMKLDYDNARTRHSAVIDADQDVERKSPADLFADFYTQQNGVPLSGEQSAYLNTLIEEIWEGRP